ncbi:Ger(x)C family spore germination protein [Metabacillus schmidteae]|uniref:Ger(x)C family spore germination protein n=1 Tax=Metabacillus schmidteae TaxID=2730405 RepID=UPI00158E1B3C|nr:Ger(x)C family spore germination protein [Metabacillus schmidteae]
MKRVIVVFFSLCLLSGCWDRRELKELGIVSAMGIDRNPDTGEILFTSQVVNPSVLKPEGGSGSPVKIITSTGDTVYKAIRNVNQEFDRNNFYAHNKVIVIGEQLAKEGILPILDAITRGKESRGYVWICIAKGMQASTILNQNQQGIEQVPANYLESLHENQKLNFDVTVIQLNDFYKKSLSLGTNPVIGVLEMSENPSSNGSKTETVQQVKLTGGAVVKGDKLVGYLNEKEARGYNWIIGEVNSGILTLPSKLEENKLVSVEIRKTKSKIKPDIKGGKISFAIEIKTSAILVEQQGAGTFKTRKEQYDYLNHIEKGLEKLIEEEVLNVVEKAQQDYQTDIFGFGTHLNKKDPKIWKDVKDQWLEDQFQNATVNVKVQADIGARELLKEPLKSKD